MFFHVMHSHSFHSMSSCICNVECHYMFFHVTCMMRATCNIYDSWIIIYIAYNLHPHYNPCKYISSAYIHMIFHTLACHSIKQQHIKLDLHVQAQNSTHSSACQSMSSTDTLQNHHTQAHIFQQVQPTSELQF